MVGAAAGRAEDAVAVADAVAADGAAAGPVAAVEWMSKRWAGERARMSAGEDLWEAAEEGRHRR